jgi:hypothetical protein
MEADTTRPASPPDPPQDQPGTTMPEHIAFILHAVVILLGYGRHLLATVRHRAAAPTFPTIAACFGTANIATILAHLNRGILRAAALERALLARAATGRDLNVVASRIRTDDTPPAPASPLAQPPVTPKAAPRPSLPPGLNDPELFMPSPEDLDRQVRRRSLGRTMVEICIDLAVVPGLCTGAFWNHLFEIIQCPGAVTVMRVKTRRERAFVQEQDRKLDSNWDWLHLKRDEIHQILGFFIGEEPVDPFARSPAPSAPTAALATGPP